LSIIDLRSDTVTLPTEEMRQAMYQAELGDDVFGEDPTINRLERLAALKTGKESSLFTPSGTMSNLIAVLAQTRHGDEVILGSEAHILWNEVGGTAALGGVVLRTVANDEAGQIDPAETEAAIRPKNLHYPPTTLICLENTHNRCGGAVIGVEYTTSIAGIAHRHGCRLHIDGARIFNAAVALGVNVSDLASPGDSISFCISKALSAPVGSLLCGSNDFIDRARKIRKMLGGGMRQAGVLAAAGIVALEMMVDRLVEDHANARRLALGLANIKGIIIDPEKVVTNIVIFEPAPDIDACSFIGKMADMGVKFTYPGGRKVRAVTHRLISRQDIETALKLISRLA
jgi:threonine aldolase